MKKSRQKKLRSHILRGMKGPMKELASELLDRGIRMRVTGNNHVMVYPPDRSQRPISLSLTASDHRAVDNAKSQCRRAGINV